MMTSMDQPDAATTRTILSEALGGALVDDSITVWWEIDEMGAWIRYRHDVGFARGGALIPTSIMRKHGLIDDGQPPAPHA